MPPVRLSTTSYVVLGMIAQRGPSTPYELKQAIAGSVGQFWHFPHAQLYSEPDRLSAHGLLDRDVEGAGRRRKTYTLTEPGRAALRRWLASPTEVEVQMRDIAELKLFFTEAGDPADAAGIAAALAAGQVAQHQRRIAALEQMVRRLGGDADADPGASPRVLALELGLETEHAALRFWKAVAAGDLHGLRRTRPRPEAGQS